MRILVKGTGVAKTDSAEKKQESKSLTHALAAARLALENQARDVQVLDLRSKTALFDYFVIATGKSGRQLRAIADDIDDLLEKKLGDRRLHTEGYSDSRWIVLDDGDVVIHLFDAEMRDFYRLDHLWEDAPRIPVQIG